MVEVFKTNVQGTEQAELLIDLLSQYFPGSKINFDLDDCDRILRIEGNNFIAGNVIRELRKQGFMCHLLE